MSDEMTGGCACGRVRFRARVTDEAAYLCHCRMCQRATGSLSIAFKNLKKADIAWESEPDWYQSSPIAARPFCRECGTSLGFAYADSENMDLTVAAFDDPARFRPVHHFAIESAHRAWLNTLGLAEYRARDNAKLVERWQKAVGRMPD